MSKPAPCFTLTQGLQALAVETIRRLWDSGRYQQNQVLQKVHDNWFPEWVVVRTCLTMASVDQQAEEIRAQWEQMDEEAAKPVFTEIEEGETPLGGPLQLSHPFIGQLDPLSSEESQ